MTITSITTTRELAHRRNDGLDIRRCFALAQRSDKSEDLVRQLGRLGDLAVEQPSDEEDVKIAGDQSDLGKEVLVAIRRNGRRDQGREHVRHPVALGIEHLGRPGVKGVGQST